MPENIVKVYNMFNVKKIMNIFVLIAMFFAIFFGFSMLENQVIKAYERTNSIYYLIAGVILLAIIIKFNLFF